MNNLFVGIDVAKAELVVALGAEGETFTTSNDDDGFRAIRERLGACPLNLVVMEATGGYETALAAALAAAEMPVVVVNPRQDTRPIPSRVGGREDLHRQGEGPLEFDT